MRTTLSVIILSALLPFSANASVFVCSLSGATAGLPYSATFNIAPNFSRGTINGVPLHQVNKPGGRFLTDGSFYYWVWAPGDSDPTIAVYKATGSIYAYYGCSRN